MAKGQQRGNREAKKPKQIKPKASATPATFSEKVAQSTDRGKPKKG